MKMFSSYHERFQQSTPALDQDNHQNYWTPPVENELKVNCDAAVDELNKRCSYGMVAHNSNGRVVFSVGKIIQW